MAISRRRRTWGGQVRCSRRCWARSTWSPWSRCWCPAWHRVRQATVPSRTTDGILAVDARDLEEYGHLGDEGDMKMTVDSSTLWRSAASTRTDEIRWLSPSTC